MRFWVLAMIIQLSLQGAARPEISREIPFQYRDGLIWVKVELAGSPTPLNFLLDSGASVSALDLQTAQKHGIHLGDQEPVQGVNGYSCGYRVADVRVTLEGNALPKGILAIDLGSVSERCNRHIDGILGVDFFRDRIVRLDFSVGKICLLKHRDTSVDNCEALPIKICNGAFCIPMRIAGNPTQWMRLDTGCDSALEWVVTRRERHEISGASIGLSSASVDYINTSVQLGSHSFDGITAGIHRKQIFPGEDGLLGNGLLAKFSVTIDGPGSRVILEKPQ
jgi:predicted aspartyl protease